MLKNVAGQVVGAQMINLTTGGDFTGAVTVYVKGDDGLQIIGAVGGGICTHEGNGYHSYAPSQAETNYDFVAYTFKATGAMTVSVQAYPDSILARIGEPTGDSIAEDISNLATVAGYLDTEIAAIVTSTGTTIPAQIAALNNLSSGQVVAALGTGSWASAIPWNAAWDAEVQSECTDALNAYDPPTRAELTTDTNSVLTAVGDVPTNAELATALSAADDAVLAAVGTVDTVVDAIKVKTDQFVFTVAGQVDANALSGGGGLDAAGVRTAVGLPAADLGDRLDSIKTDTGTTLPAVIAAALATQQIYVSDVL